MLSILLAFIGGGLGTLSRYGIYQLPLKHHSTGFPVATFIVNLVGALVIGLLWGIFEAKSIPNEYRTMLFVGFLGGFTTFSSFMLDFMKLMRNKEFITAVLYVLLTNVVGIMLVFVGYAFSQAVILKLFK